MFERVWGVVRSRIAQTPDDFSVEASHPPPPIIKNDQRWGPAASPCIALATQEQLFSSQGPIDASFLLALTNALTFVFLFLPARDRDQKLQISAFIIHF